jgi:protein-tyrosine phosphatase
MLHNNRFLGDSQRFTGSHRAAPAMILKNGFDKNVQEINKAVQTSKMIDTHCHLLPDIDDGPSTEAETYEMCRLARQDGIGIIVATPHSFDGQHLTKPDKVRTLTRKLTLDLKSTGTHMEIMPGMEVRVSAELLEHLDRDEILPLNDGTYILVEFHNSDLPLGCEHFFQKLLKSGYKAVIAHPEKNLAIQSSPEFVYKLLGIFEPWEILIQLTADSLTGAAGSHSQKCAEILLKHNLVHLIASDAHSVAERFPSLSKAVERAAHIVGEEKATKMVQDIPLAVLSGADFPAPWSPDNPRKWWRLF